MTRRMDHRTIKQLDALLEFLENNQNRMIRYSELMQHLGVTQRQLYNLIGDLRSTIPGVPLRVVYRCGYIYKEVATTPQYEIPDFMKPPPWQWIVDNGLTQMTAEYCYAAWQVYCLEGSFMSERVFEVLQEAEYGN